MQSHPERALMKFAVVAGLLLIGAAAAAQETVQVTDPAVLTSMGFPADARNVFRLVGSPPPSDFGGTTHSTPIGGKSFVGRRNTAAFPWQYDGGSEGCCESLSRRGVEDFADAEIQLPTGVRLNQFRVWVSDVNLLFEISWFVFETCHPTAAPGPSATTILASGNSTSNTGNQSFVTTLTGGPRTINNRDCHYIFRLRFDDITGLTFQRARAEWVRQVSPGPLIASFSDVPTFHPFYRFVEALVASGLTGGCGGGLYCVSSPVTRGEMAVFLSAALGLSWP
jgi:hypothetical protein